MYAAHCEIHDKPGIAWLQKDSTHAIIANRALLEQDMANSFVVVNTSKEWVSSVHDTQLDAMKSVAQLKLG